MLSAVESFGTASAAAAHPYAHHSPFAIAAAAAAAGSAAAAAAAVIPSHHHQHHLHHHHQSIKSVPATALEHHFALNRNSIYSNTSISDASNHISSSHLGGGLFLAPPPPNLSPLSSLNATANTLPSPLVLSSKCSPQEQPTSPRDRSPRSKTANFQSQDGSCPSNMSSAEFARPHPKQPRYSNNNNVNANSNNSSSNNNNNTNSHLNNNNNNYTSNAIPLHSRSTKAVTNVSKNYNNCLNNNNNIAAGDKNHCHNNNNNSNNNKNIVNKPTSISLPRSKYSNEQSGPVNLVTNNNSNSVNHNNNNCRTPPTSVSSESVSSPSSSSDGSDCNRKQMPTEMYAQNLSFSPQSLTANNNAALAAAAYQYNYSHLYASRALYGPSALFSGHHPLGHHNTIRPCPTYLGGQHEPFSPYLQAAGVYSPGVAPSVQSQSNVGIIRTAPQVLLNNNSLGVSAKPTSPLKRICSYSQSNTEDISNTNGTYLNGKVNTSPAAPESVSGFKVPSGKEGSLKHRILTRPSSSDRDGSKRRSPITASVVRSNNNSSTSNFTKGAYIELANGVLRRVEDMRTEDFIQSAEKSAVHQLAESTVVKISPTPNSVIITFSYDKNRSKADVEVSQEHPFFVYGQGWASCNTELTLKSFGLKCRRLQVGDICISLISRDHHPPQSSTAINSNHQTSIAAACRQSVPSQNYDKSDTLSLPQNLSRKLAPPPVEHTVPTSTAAVSNVTNRIASMGAPTYIPNTHHPYDEAAAAAAYENQISRHHDFYQPSLQLHHSYHRLLSHPEATLSSQSRLPLQTNLPPPPPPPQSHSAPVQQSHPPSNQSSYYPEPHLPPSSAALQNNCNSETQQQQQPVDVSLSRKRRWSAPESICDDDENECQPSTAQRLSNVNPYNT